MSWQLFTLIQIAVFAVAAIAALLIRNRRLRRDNEQLLALCGQAHEELVNVTGKLADMDATAPPETLLAQRLQALDGSDRETMVRRLVLEHEITPNPGFAEALAEYLAADGGADAEFAHRWRTTREECQQLAMFLVADRPDCLPAIQQLFEVMEPLDQACGLALPPLAPPRAGPDDDTPETASPAEPASAAAAATAAPADPTAAESPVPESAAPEPAAPEPAAPEPAASEQADPEPAAPEPAAPEPAAPEPAAPEPAAPGQAASGQAASEPAATASATEAATRTSLNQAALDALLADAEAADAADRATDPAESADAPARTGTD